MKALFATLAILFTAWTLPHPRVAAQTPDNVQGPMPPPSDKPLPPDWLMPMSIQLIQQERYEEARQLLKPVLDDHPDWGKLHFYYGLTYHKENRYEEARTYFEKATQLDPHYRAVQLFYGWCLYYLAELDLAAEQFKAFLEYKPDYPDAVFALGLIDFDQDRIDAARQKFDKVIELSRTAQDAPTEAKAHARLADVWMRQTEWEKAKAELIKSLELKPENYEPWYKLSRVLDRLGDHEGAAQAREKHDEIRDRLHPPIENQERKPVN
jgi:tetratricopeptide (TPR) repeat protein